MMVNTVGAAGCVDDVAATIKHRKGVAVLECADPPLLERDVGFDVKRRCLTTAGPYRDQVVQVHIARAVRQRWLPLTNRTTLPECGCRSSRVSTLAWVLE